MRSEYPEKVEKGRTIQGQFASKPGERHGLFLFKLQTGLRCMVVASDGAGWDHISITLKVKRCPFWNEMCELKSLFFEDEETVMQLHPPKSAWVNNVEHCLHLWRPQHAEIPLPDPMMVGVKAAGVLKGMDRRELETLRVAAQKGLV